jgi:hypothetical protein
MMLWAALAILGVPIWLILGALAIVLWNRNHVKKQPGIFAVKLRLESGSFPGFKEKAVTGYCEWVHDVLLVHKGLIMRAVPVPVAAAEEPKRFGDEPMYLRFRLDDGSILQMSDIGENETLAQGPFLIGKVSEAV